MGKLQHQRVRAAQAEGIGLLVRQGERRAVVARLVVDGPGLAHHHVHIRRGRIVVQVHRLRGVHRVGAGAVAVAGAHQVHAHRQLAARIDPDLLQPEVMHRGRTRTTTDQIGVVAAEPVVDPIAGEVAHPEHRVGELARAQRHVVQTEARTLTRLPVRVVHHVDIGILVEALAHPQDRPVQGPHVQRRADVRGRHEQLAQCWRALLPVGHALGAVRQRDLGVELGALDLTQVRPQLQIHVGIAFVTQAEERCRTRQAEAGLRTTVGRGASAAAHVGTKREGGGVGLLGHGRCTQARHGQYDARTGSGHHLRLLQESSFLLQAKGLEG